ncbi:MAG: MBOAT family O-acyltransferase, partial [Acidobacteriota bacterium]
NPLGHVADHAFAASHLHAYDAWYGLLGYALQIYFDFSGYSDMAFGLALLMGFVLVRNFDAPYRSDSITDFWRRWHISLSTWLRDYLYIPLGGSRRGPARTYVNLMTVMLLGGLWHGASWNFVIWGAIHGVMLAFERSQGKDSLYRRLPRPVRVMATFLVVCLSWVFFRAETLGHAARYLRSLFGLDEPPPSADAIAAALYAPYHVATLAVACVVVWTAPQSLAATSRLPPLRAAFFLVLLGVAIGAMWTQTANPFLYFQF